MAAPSMPSDEPSSRRRAPGGIRAIDRLRRNADHVNAEIARPKHFHDPVTGDELTLGEEASWVMQGLIRRWTFLGVITAVTVAVWTLGDLLALTWWNLGASYLALLIEGTVGIAMFSQTRRDAVILREIRKIEQRQQKHIVAIEAHLGIAVTDDP
jgi:hypothetical protein